MLCLLTVILFVHSLPGSARVNGKLVALKVIRLQEEEGTPFTAIREGEGYPWGTGCRPASSSAGPGPRITIIRNSWVSNDAYLFESKT